MTKVNLVLEVKIVSLKLPSDGLSPVSYTHLDVYKRQVYRRDISIYAKFSESCHLGNVAWV